MAQQVIKHMRATSRCAITCLPWGLDMSSPGAVGMPRFMQLRHIGGPHNYESADDVLVRRDHLAPTHGQLCVVTIRDLSPPHAPRLQHAWDRTGA